MITRLCGPCAAGQCTGPNRGGICEHHCHTTERFVVDELGPRDFAVRDTATQLSYDPSFTRKAAQEAADRRNESRSRETR